MGSLYPNPKEEDLANYEGNESCDNQSSPVGEPRKGEYEVEKSAEVPAPSESAILQAEGEQNLKDVASKEEQYIPRRQYQNQRGGRRGNSNGRGGRNGSSRGSGAYQNGRSQYHDRPGNYYPRHYHNNRGRGGGKGAGGNSNL